MANTTPKKKKLVNLKLFKNIKLGKLLTHLYLLPLTLLPSSVLVASEVKETNTSAKNKFQHQRLKVNKDANSLKTNIEPKFSPLAQSFRLLSFLDKNALQETQSMTEELLGLIGRFETTLLTAEAKASKIDGNSSDIIDKLIKENGDYRAKSSQNNLEVSNYSRSHRALKKAKKQFNLFLELSEQGRYSYAREQWHDARNTLWKDYPTDRIVSTAEIRAIWLDRGTIVKAKSAEDLVQLFDRMENAGINTVFFETVNSGYTIYPSQVAPQQNPLVKNWDPLKVAVKLAHARNMELHAWVWTFAAVNQRHNTLLNLPKDYPGPVLSRYPDWAITNKKGNRFHYNSGKAFLDPANPGVQKYLSLLLDEIATEYDVDGIHLDYIRYPFQSPTASQTYGYSLASRQKFQQLTGVDPITLDVGNPLWNQWTGFRLRQVDNFVASISKKLKQKRPELTLSAAVFPIPRQERLHKIQQHWEEWVKNEWIDMLVPMTYALETKRLKTLTKPVFEELSEGKALLLPGIRLLNIPDIVAVDQMQFLRSMSSEGYALFAAENLSPSLARVFNRLQGKNSPESLDPLPHRQPFQASHQRYQSLQKEWNFFISNNPIDLDQKTLQYWGKQADLLSLTLKDLAEQPSYRNLVTAERDLNLFRRRFSRWMKTTETIEHYQIAVWENRLDTLSRLLSYGKKRNLGTSQVSRSQ